MHLFYNSSVVFLFLIHLTLLLFSISIVVANFKSADKFFVIIIATFYLLFNYSRSGYGVDEPTYLETYIDYLHTNTFYFEYCFNIMYEVFGFLGVTAENFNKIYSSLFIILSLIIIQRNISSPYKSLCLLFFLFFATTLDFVFNAYRQGISFLFVLMALFSIQKDMKVKGTILLVIALGFHWSSIVVFLAVLLQRFLSKRIAIIINLLLILLTLVSFFIPLHIVPAMSFMLNHINNGSPYIVRAINYLNSPEASFYGLNFLGRLPLIASIMSLLIVMYFYKHAVSRFYYNYTMVMMAYCLIFLEMSYSFRNYYWILPLLPFLMVDIIKHSKCNQERYTNIMIMSLVHIILSIAGYYTSGIIIMIYK
jgi:hypothetical protein